MVLYTGLCNAGLSQSANLAYNLATLPAIDGGGIGIPDGAIVTDDGSVITTDSGDIVTTD